MNDHESSPAVERLARSAKADWRTALRRARPFLAIALIVILLDQVTKAVVRAGLDRGESWPEGWWVQITHVTNTGAAFGILEGETALLAVTSVVGIAAVVVYFLSPPIEHWLLGPALGLVLGGAIGNLIDRVRLGRVTDFIDFPHYPKFNVADSSITVGIVGLVIMLILATEPSDGDEQEDASSDS